MSPNFRLSPVVTDTSGDAASQAHKGFDPICHLVTFFSYSRKERKERDIYKEARRGKTQVTGDITPPKPYVTRVSASLLPEVTLGDNKVTDHFLRAE